MKVNNKQYVFSISEWDRLCRSLSGRKKGDLFLKHDVECKPQNALRLGEISAKYGINAVFFFQFDVFSSSIDVAAKLVAFGHEVGYHYDVLDSCNGDYHLAVERFREHINYFAANGFTVKYVCPHGNPILKRDGWSSNKDFMRSNYIRDQFPDLVDTVIDVKKIYPLGFIYISDVGYGWKVIGDISRNDLEAIPDDKVEDIYDLIETSIPLILSTHPHRWASTALEFYARKWLFLSTRYLARQLAKVSIIESLLSKVYFVARRF